MRARALLVGVALMAACGAARAWTVAEELQPGYEGRPRALLEAAGRLWVGTDAGLWNFDGLHWSRIPVEGDVRWLGRWKGALYAAGSDGLWRIEDGRARAVDSPDSVRCGLATGSALWLGTRSGLYRRAADETDFEPPLPHAPVESLAELPDGTVAVGTAGQGLFLRGEKDLRAHLTAPFAGVTDTLPGNWIHDLSVDEAGRLHLISCHHPVEDRYVIHRNALDQGLLDPRDPHLCHGSAWSVWSRPGWEVTYLLQDFPGGKDGNPDLGIGWVDDLDGDGRIERLITLNPDRRLHPRLIACFDEATAALKWKTRLVSNLLMVVPVADPRGPALLFMGAGPDNGAVYDGRRDDGSWILLLDAATGRILESWGFPGRFSIHPWYDLEDARDGRFDRPVCGLLSGPAGEAEIFRYDPRDRSLRVSEPPFSPGDARFVYSNVVRQGSRAVVCVNSEGEVDSLRLLDLEAGEVLETLPVDRFRPADRLTSTTWCSLGLAEEGDPAFLLQDHWGLSLWTPDSLVARPWPKVGGSGNRLLLRDSLGWDLILFATAGKADFLAWTLPDSRPRTTTWLADLHARLGPRLDPEDPRLPPLQPLEVLCHIEPIIPWFRVNTVNVLYSLLAGEGRPPAFLCADARSRDVTLLDRFGQRLRSLSTPRWLQDGPRWFVGAHPLSMEKSRWALLAAVEEPPWRMQAYDLRDGSPGPVFDLGIGHRDLGAVFFGQARPRAGVLSTDAGVHSMRDSLSRIVGVAGATLYDEDPGRVLVASSDRLLVLRTAPTLLAESILAVARHGDGLAVVDGRFRLTRVQGELPGPSPSLANNGPACRLLTPDDEILAAFSRPDLTGGTLWRWRDDGAGVRQASHHSLNQSGDSPAVLDARALPDGSVVAATDRGLLIRPPGEEAWSALTSRDLRFRTLLWQGDRLRATTLDGGWFEVVTADSGWGAREVSVPLRPADPILGWERERDPRWYFTERGVGAVDGPFLPLPVAPRDLAPAKGGGAWIATEQGLRRVDPSRGAILPTAVAGLEDTSLKRVLAIPLDESPDDSLVVLASDGRLLGLRLPAPSGRTLAEDEGDSLHVVAWSREGAGTPAALVRWGDGPWALQGGVEDPRGGLRVAAPPLERGRHRLQVLAVDPWGHPLGEAVALERTVRTRSMALDTVLFLVLAGLGATWALGYGRLPGYRSALAYLAVVAAALFVCHQLLCFRTLWAPTSTTALAMVGVGIVLRRRIEAQRVDPAEATARLTLLVRAFQHRSGGIGPVDELILVLRNVDRLRGGGAEEMARLQDILNRVLRGTEALAAEGRRLLEAAAVEAWIVHRALSPLEQMRLLAHPPAADPRELQVLLARRDRREALLAAAEGFLDGMEALGDALRQRRGCELAALLRSQARRVDLTEQERIAVEVDAPARAVPVAAPQGEVEEVLDNLLRNAVQILGETAGEKTVRLRLRTEKGRARLEVEDTGPGVDPAQAEAIFAEGTSLRGGTGFGLAHCRRLVEGWGGTLRLDPGYRGGARFVLTLPVDVKRA